MRLSFGLSAAALILGVALSLSQTVSLPGASTSDEWRPVTYDIPYAKPADPSAAQRQTLDLYLPVGSGQKPPLLIFVHGGFWTLSDDKYRIGPALASSLRASGVAVALARYRLAPGYRHPAQARDVAAAVAYLVQTADMYGYDRKRIYLAGHSAGAHLAALVALDPAYLGRHKLNSQSVAGVVAISGIYDLAPETPISEQQREATRRAFGASAAVLKAASPIHHARADSPPFLVLSAARDFAGFHVDARKFADRLRAAGNEKMQQFMVGGVDHFSVVNLNGENPARSALLSFMGVEAMPERLGAWVEAKQRWSRPPFSTLPFWKHKSLVRSYPVDDSFLKRLLFVFQSRREELLEWPLKQYHAIDLFSYLDALPKEEAGQGDFLVITNVRGERQIWSRQQIEPYRPVIVVGIDDERNLFRFSVFYRMLRQYSWKEGEATPMLALTLGGFIHFLKDPPRELQPQSWHYGLTENSFRRVKEDPLKAIRDVPKDVHEALTFRNGCVYCHNFRSAGARSHHVLARTGEPHGGFALPLESYPPEVWKTFMFDQEKVAKKMGATPNIVAEGARETLYDLVNEERQ
ncbi:MAG: alpha/beta hydrolase [Candidatus Binatia bacterium]